MGYIILWIIENKDEKIQIFSDEAQVNGAPRLLYINNEERIP